jgi:hypothetical protein
MSAADLKTYGRVLDELVGAPCERSLAANSLKLRFGCERDARGTHYIWIDPPWRLYGLSGLVAASSDHPAPDSPEYSREWFDRWSALFAPLDRATFTGYESLADGTLVLRFGSEFRIVLPLDESEPEEASWYGHWYATATERA